MSLYIKAFFLPSLFIGLANTFGLTEVGFGLGEALLEGSLDTLTNGVSWLPSILGEVSELSLEAIKEKNINISGIPESSRIFDNLFNSPYVTETTCQIARKDGFKCEEHDVQTPDGYIIGLHRIPGGSCFNKSLVPVILVHSLLTSSADWVLLGKNDALAYLLADSCRDVWMMNHRGNTYSRKHAFLDDSSPEYWNWTYHEMGVIDVPSVIDYVLCKTDHTQLDYIGHSLGNAILYVTLSMLPAYNDKIKLFVAFAPVAFLKHSTSLLGAFAYITDEVTELYSIVGRYGFLIRSFALDQTLKVICGIGTGVCKIIFFEIVGVDPQQLTDDILIKYLRHNPSGTSTELMGHLAKSVTLDTFAQNDYGEANNLKVYNSTTPPDYPLEKIRACIILIYAPNDKLATPQDVLKLSETLKPTRHQLIKVDYDYFSHTDFVHAKDVKSLVYDMVIRKLNNADKECTKI